MKRLSFIVLAGLLFILASAVGVGFAQDEANTYEARYSFSYPTEWELTESGTTDLVRLDSGDSAVIVAGPASYVTVIGGETFDSAAEELTFYLERSGYEVVEERDNGSLVVTLERRGQIGNARQLDLGNGRVGALIALGTDAQNLGDVLAVADGIAGSIDYPADIVDVAINTEGFGTLVAAVQAAGLEDTLRGGDFTVFAPTDDAFAAALEALGLTAEELLADTETLSSILTYHVVEGTVLAEDVVGLDGMEVATVNGATLTVSTADGVQLIDGMGNAVNVVTTDVMAFNGVIHVIDAVLLPPAEEEEMAMEEAEEPAEEEMAMEDPGTILDIAAASEDFRSLTVALDVTGLSEVLAGEGPFTVFAPTNDAFAAALEALGLTMGDLMGNTELLSSILTYHVVEGAFLAEDVVGLDGMDVATVNGASVTVSVTDDGVQLIDGTGNAVNVVTTDIVASNGVIHVIDFVLLPEAPQVAMEEMEEATEEPEMVMEPVSYEGRFSFSGPAGFALTESGTTDLLRLDADGSVVVVVGPDSYASVLGGESFDSAADELAFYLERSGYAVGEGDETGFAVSLDRRGQSGTAQQLDLENGRIGALIVLGEGEEGLAAAQAAADEVLATIDFPADIVDVAVSTEGFSTLVAAVQAAGLEDTLRGGEFTVFAPTDDAFAAALEALGLTAEELLADTELLELVLTYHVVEGTVLAADVVGLDGMDVTTVNGDALTVSVVDGGVQLIDTTGNAVNVVATDVEAFNGVIHVIDGVLLPNLPIEYNDRFSFTAPRGFSLLESGTTDLLRVEGDSNNVVVVAGPSSYASVLGGETFESAADELAFYLERTGYDVGEGDETGVAVTLDRRGQSGTAQQVDLGNGRTGALVVLGEGEESLAAAQTAADEILSTIDYPADIVDVAVSTEGFGTLVAAVQAAGLEDTLRGGEFTVFAPTDDAFAAALEALNISAEDLLANTDLLSSILTYHVVEGTFLAEDVVGLDGMEVETVNGATLTVGVTDDGVTLTDALGNVINVVATDVEAFNGVIHVIDGVLLPESPFPSIVDIVSDNEDFSILLAAIQNADPAILETLSSEESFTVFAPDNVAFLDLLDFLGLSQADLLAQQDLLTQVLLYHVVEGAVFAEDVAAFDGQGVDTLLEGQRFGVDISDDGRVFLNNVVEVTSTDINASNGVVHVIEDVLLPFPVLVELGLAGN